MPNDSKLIKDNKDKYKLALGILTAFKKIQSRKAYRLITLFDLFILLLNSHFLAYLLGFVTNSVSV